MLILASSLAATSAQAESFCTGGIIIERPTTSWGTSLIINGAQTEELWDFSSIVAASQQNPKIIDAVVRNLNDDVDSKIRCRTMVTYGAGLYGAVIVALFTRAIIEWIQNSTVRQAEREKKIAEIKVQMLEKLGQKAL